MSSPMEVLWFCFMGFMGMMFVRLHFTAECRTQVMDDLHDQVLRDIEAGESFEWRWKAFNQVSFDRMLFMVWIWPVSKCWPDLKMTWPREEINLTIKKEIK